MIISGSGCFAYINAACSDVGICIHIGGFFIGTENKIFERTWRHLCHKELHFFILLKNTELPAGAVIDKLTQIDSSSAVYCFKKILPVITDRNVAFLPYSTDS